MDLATSLGSSDGFLIASIADRYAGRCSVVAYSWKDLISRKTPKVSWSVDQSNISQMPVDINQICVEDEGHNSCTAGRFFLAGGGPPVGQAGEAANAIKVCIRACTFILAART